jgi:ubiquinone/menaquinone biosynthesis C-methylase UbiE
VHDGAGRTARVAALFDELARTYGSVGVPWFDAVAAHLVEAVAPRPGKQVLDLGCGRGAALVPPARGVGPRAAAGVDV